MFQESLSQVGVTAAYGAGAIKRSMYDKKVAEEQRERTKKNEDTVNALRQAKTTYYNQAALTEKERTKEQKDLAIKAKHQKKTSYEEEKQAKIKTQKMASELGGQNAK